MHHESPSAKHFTERRLASKNETEPTELTEFQISQYQVSAISLIFNYCYDRYNLILDVLFKCFDQDLFVDGSTLYHAFDVQHLYDNQYGSHP